MQITSNGNPTAPKKAPYNKGDAYEEKIVEILRKKNLLPPGFTRAGAGGGTDSVFLHKRALYLLEIKKDLLADYGQKMLKWSREKGWEWCKDDEVTKMYTHQGVIEYLNEKKMEPNLFTMEKEKLTPALRNEDQKVFEDKSVEAPVDLFWNLYRLKGVFYLQVGQGYGFYSLKEDPADLGVPKFQTSFTLRFRAKVIESEPTYKYGFYAVLKVKGKPEKSPFNIEPDKSQSFPKISP